jgi:hypothetical protein
MHRRRRAHPVTQERLDLHEGGWTEGFAKLEELLG